MAIDPGYLEMLVNIEPVRHQPFHHPSRCRDPFCDLHRRDLEPENQVELLKIEA